MSFKRLSVRVLAAGLAALGLLVPAVAGLHGATASHRYCPEHATLEELPGGAARPAPPAEGITPGAPEGPDAHTQCAFAVSSPTSERVSHPPPAPAPAAIAGGAPALPPTPILPQQVLSVAPKTSPPSSQV